MTAFQTLPDLASALPSRRVAVRPPRTAGPSGSLELLALLLGLLAGVTWWLGPALVRDWRIGNDAVSASDARVEDASCRTRLLVLRLCNLTLVEDRAAVGARHTLWYVYLDVAGDLSESERFAPVRSRSNPELLSTDLGLERRVARSTALALAIAILALGIGATVRVVQQGVRDLRVFRNLSGQRMLPVLVKIERRNMVPLRRRLWIYLYDDAGRPRRAAIELPSSVHPLFVDASETHALALRSENGGAPLLLDANLDFLDLTAAEKAAFRAACRTALSNEQDGGNSA